jgi:hypothetical protein
MSLDKKILTLDLLANQQKQNFATQFGRFYNKPEIKEAAELVVNTINTRVAVTEVKLKELASASNGDVDQQKKKRVKKQSPTLYRCVATMIF